MKINEKRVARPPKSVMLEIHFEGNLICCKWAKNILLRSVQGLHCVSVCCVYLSACVCGRWGRYALNSSAERRETQEPVNNSSNSILFLHDCSLALPSSTSEYNSRMWGRTCQKLVRNKVWLVYFRCVVICMVSPSRSTKGFIFEGCPCGMPVE